MNVSYSKKNYIVRAALWLEYKGKCFYEGLPLRFKDMHIDHIIPESITNEELKGIISTLGLPVDFNINSLYNLVPCSPHVNQVKNKNQYPITFLAHCIYDGTVKKAERIKKRIEQLSKEYKSDKDLAKLIAYLNISENKKSLENIYNALSKEKPFDEIRKVKKYNDSYTYEKSLPNVKLAGLLPVYPTMKGSCLITFSNLRLRDCMITLNHEQIMKQLFEGAKTKLENKLRNFITFSEEFDTYFVDLANVRLPLEKDEVIQLLKIIDDFYDLYMKESTFLFHTFDRDYFSKTGSGNQVRLFKISKQLWFIIQDFCREFDYENGNTDWNIFNAKGSTNINVYDEKEGEFRLYIYPEIEKTDYLVRVIDDDVWLVWTDQYFWNANISDFMNDKYWTPLTAYYWLVKELIPQVTYWYENKNKNIFKKRQSLEEYKLHFDITNYANYLPVIKHGDDLLGYVSMLQSFFNQMAHTMLELSNLSIVYRCLYQIVEKAEVGNKEIRYISKKLSLQNISDKKTLLEGIYILSTQSNNEIIVISSFSIDLIFRCMVVALRDCKNHLTTSEIKAIKNNTNQYHRLMLQERVRKEL